MRRIIQSLTIFSMGVLVICCAPKVTPTLVVIPTNTIAPSITPIGITVNPTFTPGPTRTETTLPPSATPWYPIQGRGPTGFGRNVNPLTGLDVADPSLLNRRTIAIKVENLPRGDRPQWGLSDADIVYEYYTEEGSTRFIAVYYGQNSDKVGPIRSGRFFDSNVVQMYKSIFIFGYAWRPVFDSFLNSDFKNRLVLETNHTSPTIFRTSGEGNYDLLFANLNHLPGLLNLLGIDNTQQDLDGMYFNTLVPGTTQLANTVAIRYSQAIYNRWEYDPRTGVYIRSEDVSNAEWINDESYTVLIDRNNGQPITANNIVILYVPYEIYIRNSTTEVYKIPLLGSGLAFLIRDGEIYQLTWQRNSSSDVLSLVGGDGNRFPLKPGNTWFEVIHTTSELTQPAFDSWRFTMRFP
jgi:hypothetical protein